MMIAIAVCVLLHLSYLGTHEKILSLCVGADLNTWAKTNDTYERRGERIDVDAIVMRHEAANSSNYNTLVR